MKVNTATMPDVEQEEFVSEMTSSILFKITD